MLFYCYCYCYYYYYYFYYYYYYYYFYYYCRQRALDAAKAEILVVVAVWATAVFDIIFILLNFYFIILATVVVVVTVIKTVALSIHGSPVLRLLVLLLSPLQLFLSLRTDRRTAWGAARATHAARHTRRCHMITVAALLRPDGRFEGCALYLYHTCGIMFIIRVTFNVT